MPPEEIIDEARAYITSIRLSSGSIAWTAEKAAELLTRFADAKRAAARNAAGMSAAHFARMVGVYPRTFQHFVKRCNSSGHRWPELAALVDGPKRKVKAPPKGDLDVFAEAGIAQQDTRGGLHLAREHAERGCILADIDKARRAITDVCVSAIIDRFPVAQPVTEDAMGDAIDKALADSIPLVERWLRARLCAEACGLKV